LSRTTVKSGDVQANICCNVFRITRSIIPSGARDLAKADDVTCANHRSMSNHVCNLLGRLMRLRMTILQNRTTPVADRAPLPSVRFPEYASPVHTGGNIHASPFA